MPRLLKLCLLLFIFCLTIVTQTGYAQEGGVPPGDSGPTSLDPTTRFTHLTTADGLPDSHIEVIFQDSQGFMWFGTNDGLSRYDGYHFTNYRHEPDNPNSLVGNGIFDIIEDNQGRLWIAGGRGGVTLFDPRTEQFSPLQFNDLPPDTAVFTLFEDSAGFIWMGSPSNGISRYNPATDTLTPHPFDPDSQLSRRNQAVWEMIEDEAGHLWLAASKDLVKFDPQSGQFTFYVPPNDSGEIRSLYRDEAGHIWLHGSALHQFEPQSETFTTYPLPIRSNILSILADSRGKMWVATFDGLLQFDLQSQQFTRHFRYQPTNLDSLSENRLFSLYEDQAGLIWIGTDTDGLNRLNPRQSQFTHYRFETDTSGGPGASKVTSLTGDESGTLWLGIDMALYQVDLADGLAKRYTPNRPPNPDPFGMMTLHRDRAGSVWFGMDNALYRFDPTSREFTRYEIDSNNRPGPPNPIMAIYEDPAGFLWVGRRLEGLYRFDPTTETFEPYPLIPATEDVAEVNTASVFYEAPNGNGEVWVSGSPRLARFNPTRPENAPIVYNTDYASANALYQNQSGQFWMPAQDGLYHFDPATETFTRYSNQDGLPSNRIMSLLVDARGNLWLGTGNGLSRFDPSANSGQAPHTKIFHNYDVTDGLQGNEFSAAAAWQAPDGRMFFGGENGLTAFYPDEIEDNPYQPPVRLTNVNLFNEPLTIGEDSLLAQAINFTDHLTFNHNQNIISFEFAALSYATPYKNRYRYKLEGFEADWNEVDSNRRFATYTNLPAGDYVLRVQGSNDSGLWSKHEAVLNITILPPWWETLWFRGLALVVLVALAYAGYRWRVYALEQSRRELETEVAARTWELQESEDRFATVMNSFEGIIYVADMDTYELLFVNEYTRGIFGDVEGNLCWQALQAGQTGPCEFCTNKYLVNNGVPTGIYTWELQNTSTEQWYHIQDRVIRWVDGRLVRLEVATDITELKQTEEDLRQAKQSAETANRAKSAFLANMSHELRTPLNAIIGFAQIIARGKNLPVEQRQHLEIINRSGEHLLTLINQVLELSKIEAGRMALKETAFDLHQLLTELEGMFRLRADDKHIRLIFERSPDVPRTIRTDDVKLRQVLINLLNNALKFTQKGSVILKVRLKDEGEGLKTDAGEKEIQPLQGKASAFSLLTFAISDTGPGIAPEEIGRLFEAFSQTETGRQAQEGTGLGLPISQKFVQLLGGDEIRVESPAQLSFGDKRGPGATFAFDIRAEVVSPVAMNKEEPPAGSRVSEIAVRAVSLAPNQPRYRLLIVDDDSTNRQLLRELLAPFDFALQEAKNGRQAIEIWQEFQPHLIWMDMRMPVLDGYEATQIIKAKQTKTKIIALTASSFEEEKTEILDAGCDDFLRKPFREAELFQLMSRHIGVQFIYETLDELPAAGDRDRQPLTPEMLAAVPLEHLTQLAEAIELSDVAWANKIIDTIQQSQPDLAWILRRQVNNFEYSAILAVISQVTSTKSN